MLETKFVSSLEKCFLDQTPADFPAVDRIRMYQNTIGTVQLLTYDGTESCNPHNVFKVEVSGVPASCVRLRTVESVPNYIPCPFTPELAHREDPGFVRTTPGLYPDALIPLWYNGCITLIHQQLRALWIDIENDGTLTAGDHELTVRLLNEAGTTVAENRLTVEVIGTVLPEQDTIVTQWLYADCLADYYDVDVFSDRHFEICENYIRTAVKNGINMILMPVFTPPLDTGVGCERTTTQLVGVTLEKGEYRFDFSLVDRWMTMCQHCGVKYFEVSHLFTQWGAYHAPKIMATVDGEYRRIFGWETDAAGEDYVRFLREFLTAFTAHLRAKGLVDTVYFHISDEPSEQHLDQYRINTANVRPYIEGFKQLDALSHVEFYQQGLCQIPVPSTAVMKDFMKEEIEERWTYYCCGPWLRAANRFMSMSSARTRCTGLQMYKYGIKGFLQWGYNFYNSRFSMDVVDPFLNANGGNWVSGGDSYSVYPGRGGKPMESVRLIAFRQGLEDIRVMKLCERYLPKEELIRRMEAICGELTFDNCINDNSVMTAIRDMMDDIVLQGLRK